MIIYLVLIASAFLLLLLWAYNRVCRELEKDHRRARDYQNRRFENGNIWDVDESIFSDNNERQVPLRGFTHHEVSETGFLLRQTGLPTELVTPILNYAQYWVRNTYSREDILYVSCDQVCMGNEIYLQTARIGADGLTGLKPVKRVAFVIETFDYFLLPAYEDSKWFGARKGNSPILTNKEGEDGVEGKGKGLLGLLREKVGASKGEGQDLSSVYDPTLVISELQMKSPMEPSWMATEGKEVVRVFCRDE